MKRSGSIPKAAILRLSLYLRELSELSRKDQTTISSRKLADMLGLTDAQVRKDLAYFGQFGYPGVGYRVDELMQELRHILGTDRMWEVVVIGCGNLGRALASYGRFREQGFNVVGLFDADPGKVDTQVAELTVQPMSELGRIVGERNVHIAVICVPPEHAQSVADEVVAAGIKGILNFAPTSIDVPPHVVKIGVDLAIRLEQLSFRLREMDGAPTTDE